MKKSLFFHMIALLMVAIFACSGCGSYGASTETKACTGVPTETTQPRGTVSYTTEATLPVIEGVPPEIVEAFDLMHRRMEEGTLHMRIYDRGFMLPAINIPMDSLVGEDLSGRSLNLDAIVVENYELQEHRELVQALQPQMLSRISELQDGAGYHEDICLAYILETDEDGIILKIGFNIGTRDLFFSEDFYDEISLYVNGCFYYHDAAFYELVRTFMTEENQAIWDPSFRN